MVAEVGFEPTPPERPKKGPFNDCLDRLFLFIIFSLSLFVEKSFEFKRSIILLFIIFIWSNWAKKSIQFFWNQIQWFLNCFENLFLLFVWVLKATYIVIIIIITRGMELKFYKIQSQSKNRKGIYCLLLSLYSIIIIIIFVVIILKNVLMI